LVGYYEDGKHMVTFAEDNNGTLKSKEINSNQNNKTNGLGLKIFL